MFIPEKLFINTPEKHQLLMFFLLTNNIEVVEWIHYNNNP